MVWGVPRAILVFLKQLGNVLHGLNENNECKKMTCNCYNLRWINGSTSLIGMDGLSFKFQGLVVGPAAFK